MLQARGQTPKRGAGFEGRSVSTESDRQSTDLQRDALLAAGVDARHLFKDRASGVKNNRSGGTRVGKLVQTIFPYGSLRPEVLRRELNEALNVVGRWNGVA